MFLGCEYYRRPREEVRCGLEKREHTKAAPKEDLVNHFRRSIRRILWVWMGRDVVNTKLRHRIGIGVRLLPQLTCSSPRM
jgi:hypothetical protein